MGARQHLTPDPNGNNRTCLLDLVPSRPVPVRSGKVDTDWLTDRGEGFRDRVQVATLNPFHGYKNAIDDRLDDSRALLDAFHVVKLATT